MFIALEGIDGAGKSTQAAMLEDWLTNGGDKPSSTWGPHSTLLTKWNSSPLIKPALKEAKKQRALTPTMFALLEAADLADRWDREISPALIDGRTVIADRWVYTAFARGMARGLDAAWLRSVYSFVPKPDLCFYLELPVEEALNRIARYRPVKFYEAGMDIGFSENHVESFLEFQQLGRAAYSSIGLVEKCFVVIDATVSTEALQEIIRAAVAEYAKSVFTVQGGDFLLADNQTFTQV
jgi:dTMP kinase